MTDLDDMRAERDAARSLAASLEQQCAVRDEALAELRALHSEYRIYDPCDCGHSDEAIAAGDAIDTGEFIACEKTYLYSICAECCTDHVGDQTEACVDDHPHAPEDKAYCATVGILDALAARLSAQLFPTDEEGDRRPSTDELLGIAPDWCGGLSVDEYMDRQRGRTTDEEGASDE